LNFFHPFPMLNIVGDPLIFLPLKIHIFMCLTSLCLLHIVISMWILPLCFIRNLWAIRSTKK
jgi:hypothetical protein